MTDTAYFLAYFEDVNDGGRGALVETGKPVAGYSMPSGNVRGEPSDSAFSPDGTMLAVTNKSSVHLVIYNTTDWSVIPNTPSPSDECLSCEFSPDGLLLAVGVDVYGQGAGLLVYNTSDWSEVTGIPENGGDGEAVAFSPDGTLLAVTKYSLDGVFVLNTSDWTIVTTSVFTADNRRAYGLSFSPDGAYLALASSNSDSYLYIVNTSDWSLVSIIPGVLALAYDCKFSPDGAYLAAATEASSGAKGLYVVDTSDWSLVAGTPTINDHCSSVDFSNDGRLIAIGDTRGLSVIDTQNWDKLPGPATTNKCTGVSFFKTKKNITGIQVSLTLHDGQEHTGADYTFRDFDGNSLVDGSVAFGEDADLITPFPPAAVILSASGVDGSIAAEAYHLGGGFARENLQLTYVGDRATISSNLTTQAGSAGDEVVIRGWGTRELVAKVIPDSAGDWSAEVPPGVYDVSYLAEGCAPIIHGPYTVELPAP
jgi:DNA-binding beta-propeller fold protein YncE